MTASRNQQMVRFLGVALVAIMVACSWLSPFDTTANAQLDAGLKRAAATYASARLLNGAISVVQGTQISAAPAGMGMTFAPGEILDPLNDLVEQFSQVMLVAINDLGCPALAWHEAYRREENGKPLRSQVRPHKLSELLIFYAIADKNIRHDEVAFVSTLLRPS